MDFETLWDSRKFHRTVVDLINRIRANGKRTTSETIAEECKEYFQDIMEAGSVILPTIELADAIATQPIAQVHNGGAEKKIEIPPEVMELAKGAPPAPRKSTGTWEDAARILRQANDKGQRIAEIPMLTGEGIQKACKDAGWSNIQITDIRATPNGQVQVITR